LCALPPTPEVDELALEAACGVVGSGFYATPSIAASELVAFCAQALRRAEASGSGDWLAALHTHSAALALMTRDLAGVLAHSDLALEHAARSSDSSLRAGLRARLAYSDLTVRGMAEALRRIERALAEPGVDERAHTRAGLRDSPRLRLTVFRAYALSGIGRLAEAEALFREVHATATRQGHVASEFASQVGYAALLRSRGDGASSLAVSQSILARAEAVGSPYWRAGGLQARHYARAILGEWSTLLAESDDTADLLNPSTRPALEILRAEALWRLGKLEAARAVVDSIEPGYLRELADGQLVPTNRFSARLSLARVRLGLDGAAARVAVEALLASQSARVARDESPVGAAYVALERAALARVLGDEAGRRSQLEFARGAFAAAPAPRMVAEVDRELAGIR
jgi:hypothetical protein